MNFIEALKKCEHSKERVRSPIVEAKGDLNNKTKIFRPEWKEISYPANFVWVSQTNIPMVSIGEGQSMPLMLEVVDLIADDWEVLQNE